MRIGSLFSGYGGLDLAVANVTGAEVAWHCEWDDAPSKILEKHFPGVPNYRDVSKVDFSEVKQVDILTGGFPCQDLSMAGKRAGLKAGTRSGLWSEFARAIETIRPRLVVIENVRGLLSATASNPEMEPCPFCMGDFGDGEPTMRRLEPFSQTWPTSGMMRNGEVFELPMQELRTTDLEYSSLPTPATSEPGFTFQPVDKDGNPTDNPNERWYDPETGRLVQKGIKQVLNAQLPTPTAQAAKHGSTPDVGSNTPMGANLWDLPHVLPTPTTQDGKNNAGPSQFNRNTKPLNVEAVMLPTLRASDGYERRNQKTMDKIASEGGDMTMPTLARTTTDWGKFAPAIRRWEEILNRPAPAPTKPDGKDGNHRLSSAFTEWMMGVPEGG